MKTSLCLSVLLLLMMSLGTLMGQEAGLTVKGVLMHAEQGEPIEFATVSIKDKETGQVLAGTTTSIDGTFEVLAEAPEFFIEFSYVGFQTEAIADFKVNNNTVDLGVVKLYEASRLLEEVVVRAEKSNVEFKLDRRVFNVGQDLASSGASAFEVLNNIPSVNVNIEGDISLRGSGGVRILINGKPSVLADESGNALGSITAEMIDKVEVITNPGAKYEAEGTAGIINIVLKKEEKKGLNGSITLNGGIPDNHSIGLSLNRRTEKFNLFTQAGIGYRSLPRDNRSVNESLGAQGQVLQRLESEGIQYRNELFLQPDLRNGLPHQQTQCHHPFR